MLVDEEIDNRPRDRVVGHRRGQQIPDRASIEANRKLGELRRDRGLDVLVGLGKGDAERSQRIQSDAERLAKFAGLRIQLDAQAVNLGLVQVRGRLVQERVEESDRRIEVAGQVLAFSEEQVEFEGCLVAARPEVRRRERGCLRQVVARGNIGSRPPGALAGHDVQRGDPLALFLGVDEVPRYD